MNLEDSMISERKIVSKDQKVNDFIYVKCQNRQIQREIENRLVVAQDWWCVVGEGVDESEESV